jgi:sirohydrochlorin ferrochelatase
MTRAPRARPAPLDSAIVIYDDQPPETLPVRGRSSLPSGRHRRPASADLPPDAPVLVLAVPGEKPDVADEIASLTRAARSEGELDVRVAPLGGSAFTDVLRGLPDDRSAVVVPLITGPNPRVYHAIHTGLDEAGVKATVTDPLGPHPLLAEALHVRLADAGLARADRIRQFSIGAAVDGVIVAAVGGVEAAREADMTAVLLAARLAVPVVAAAIDGQPTVADAVGRLRESGGQRIAVAPYVIGPELDHAQLAKLAAEAGLGCGAPLGAHSSVVRLINLRYEVAMEATMDEGTS